METVYVDDQIDLEAKFFIAQKLRDSWHVMETANNPTQALIAQEDIFIQDRINNPYQSENDYKIFLKNTINIIKEETCN